MKEIVVPAFLTGGTITGPMEFEGMGTVWRYEGKATFAHQHEEACACSASTARRARDARRALRRAHWTGRVGRSLPWWRLIHCTGAAHTTLAAWISGHSAL